MQLLVAVELLSPNYVTNLGRASPAAIVQSLLAYSLPALLNISRHTLVAMSTAPHPQVSQLIGPMHLGR